VGRGESKTDGYTCQRCFKEVVLPVMDYHKAKEEIGSSSKINGGSKYK